MGAWTTFALAAMVATPALAAEVYINNTKVTGLVKQQTLPKVNVRFDAAGDVYIEAPGYKLEVVTPGQPPTQVGSVPTVAGRYWMIINVPTPGHYGISITANGQQVANVPARSQQYVAELTNKLNPGANLVQVTFLPEPNAPITAPVEAVNVLLGQGDQAADGTLTVSRVLGTIKRQTGVKSAEMIPLSFELQK